MIGLGGVGTDGSEEDDVFEAAARVREHGSEELVMWLREEEPDLPEWFADQMRGTDPEMFALAIEAWAPWQAWEDFTLVQCPTLIIVGEMEEPDAGEHAARAAALMRDARAVVLPGLAHVAAFVRSDLTLPHVTEFLEAVARPRAEP
jgi:pimeloyl-ACP methyl ester carboxylesterase